jgi:Phage Tail Collar Domain
MGDSVRTLAWLTKGNAGTSAGTNFVGTIDAQDLVLKTNSIENMRILNTNGNVGIGTATPTEKLHVVNRCIKLDGDANTVANASYLMFGLNNSTNIGYVGDGASGDNNMYLYSFNNDVRLGTGATSSAKNSIYLDQSGNTGVGVMPAATSAKLDITSTTSGFAMPRMTSAQRKAIVSPIDGLQVYDTNLKGIYIYDGTKWDCVSVPAGSVGYFANATAPNGYLECNGQYVNTTTYAELFAAIGTVYGPLVGATFKLPDLRGEFVRGVDNARGADPSRLIGSSQQASAMRSETGNLGCAIIGGVNLEPTYTTPWAGGGGGAVGGSCTPGTFTWMPVRPRNVAMLPCIKF